MWPVDDHSQIGQAHAQARRVRDLETALENLIRVVSGSMSNASLEQLLAVSAAIAIARRTLKGDTP